MADTWRLDSTEEVRATLLKHHRLPGLEARASASQDFIACLGWTWGLEAFSDKGVFGVSGVGS